MKIYQEKHRLVVADGNSRLWLEPWGENALRLRMSPYPQMDTHDWALNEPPEKTCSQISFEKVDTTDPWYLGEEKQVHHRWETIGRITNGKITATVNAEGWICYYNQRGEMLTAEYWRNRDRINRYCVPLRISAREMTPVPGVKEVKLTARFEAFDDEQLFGMGQYQQKQLDKKGCVLELAQRNSQASVPFVLSSRGYGFLWNNPAVGSVTFASNITQWQAQRTAKLDYYITAGDTPQEIIFQYSAVTGRVPMMPEYGLGYWQSKLRYQNQKEVLSVAREYKRRGLPLDVIVIDFFHWTRQGEYRFEPRDWPDPDSMVKELKKMGIETAVSVWPTVDTRSRYYDEMKAQGYLVQSDRGSPIHMTWMENAVFYDATHPGARSFVWNLCRDNYYEKGIRCFWLDEAEPEYDVYDFDNYRYFAGPAAQCANIYPLEYARGFYEGLKEAGEREIINLTRSAWVGSQKYGVLAWSGDIHSSFRAMREQLQAGLSMGVAGIPWWTCDIGGFLGGMTDDPAFRELLMRWFAWGCFCPVFRMHGERQPLYEQEVESIDHVRQMSSGQPNEVWSFGDKVYKVLCRYLMIRQRLRPYVRRLMREAHETGMPVMRPLFFEFPDDVKCWHVEDTYMFGPDLLVAPVMEAGQEQRSVYLPAACRWTDANTGITYEGGQTVAVPAPIEIIPVLMREGRRYPIYDT